MSEEKAVGRRDFFLKGISFIADRIVEKVDDKAREMVGGNCLRPPGAVDEAVFLSLCTRCDDCLSACPHGSIKKADNSFGVAAAGTPVIVPSERPCYLCDDFPCIRACPADALLPVNDKRDVRMGKASVDADLCYCWNGGTMYPICVLKCPLSGEAIISEDSKPVVIEDRCVGCGVCEGACKAVNNQVAIRVKR